MSCLAAVCFANGDLHGAFNAFYADFKKEDHYMNIMVFAEFLNTQYEQIRRAKNVMLLSQLATVFVWEEAFTEEYNKVCWLIQEYLAR